MSRIVPVFQIWKNFHKNNIKFRRPSTSTEPIPLGSFSEAQDISSCLDALLPVFDTDLFLFQNMKSTMINRQFQTKEEIEEYTWWNLHTFPQNNFQETF